MKRSTLDEDVQLLERRNRILEKQLRILRAHLQQTRGLAHDINSSASAVCGFSKLILDLFNQEGGFLASRHDQYLNMLESINSAGWKLSKDIEAIHTLAIAEDYPLNTLDLNKVVSGFISEPEYLWIRENNRAVDVTISYSPSHLYFKGSEEHIERVISNLLRNAVEAVYTKQDGKVTIETMAETKKDLVYEEQQEYAVLSVADNGCGISPENQARLFRHSFSTKNSGSVQRRGCGLTVIEGIVREHKGHIQVYSEIDAGTQFKVYLPMLNVSSLAEETVKTNK